MEVLGKSAFRKGEERRNKGQREEGRSMRGGGVRGPLRLKKKKKKDGRKER